MEMKLEEFLKLHQGGKSVMEYVGKFNYMSQYAQSMSTLMPRRSDALCVVSIASFRLC
jgi:hypothetical protein